MISSLNVLHLESNKLQGPIPSTLGQLTNLQELYLHSNMLTGSIPPSLGSLSKLQYLVIGTNLLSGNIPKELGKLNNLKMLQIENNQIAGVIPQELGQLVNLQYLYLNKNKLSGVIPTSLGNLRYLLEMVLSYNMFTGGIPTSLGNLSNIQAIDISYAHLQGVIPSNMGIPRNLSILNLSNNDLIGNVPSNFSNPSSLIYINIKKNHFNGPIPMSWSKLQNLRVLHLGFNQLEGSIPNWLWDMPKLQFIDLSSNYFQGNLSYHVSHLSAFKANIKLSQGLVNKLYDDGVTLQAQKVDGAYSHNISIVSSLDLSNNQLFGAIPNSIGELLNMYNLNLSLNKFEGPIPQTISKCQNLMLLDLSYNKLAYKIPKELGSLQSLMIFNVSFNNLSGEVPKGGKLQSFSNQSFLGNPYLCGSPLPSCNKKERGKKANKNVVAYAGPITAVILVGGISFLSIYCRWKQSKEKPSIQIFEKSLKGLWMEIMLALQRQCNERTQVGVGGMASVYRIVLSNGRALAVKRLNMEVINVDSIGLLRTEIRKLSHAKHKNVLQLLAMCSRPVNLLSCIFDYMPNKSLEYHLHPSSIENHIMMSQARPLTWSQRYNIAIGIAQGLNYLHNEFGFGQILHLDLKPNNVLLDENYDPCISDFGISNILIKGSDTKSIAGISKCCTSYIAPELSYTQEVTDKADIYSFGIILLELVTGKKPSSTNEERLDLRSWVLSFFGSDYDPSTTDQHIQISQENMDVLIDNAMPDKEKAKLREEMLKQITQVLQVGMLCTHQSPLGRPSIKETLNMLTFKDTDNTPNDNLDVNA